MSRTASHRTRRRTSGLTALVLGLVLSSVVTTSAQADENDKLILVLDSSGSMKERVRGKTKISMAKAALNTVIGGLPATALVGLRVYGATVFDQSEKGACTDSQLVVPIGTGNRKKLRAAVAKYKPYGETPISHSLKEAAQDLGDSGQRSIVLVSDGEETCDQDPCATAAAIAKQSIDVKIDVVGLRVKGKARAQLRCIADRGRGTYYDADDTADLEASLNTLSTRAFRPFRVSGTPAHGTVQLAGAPTLTPGQYTDTFPAENQSRHYWIRRTSPGTTLHVGLTSRPTLTAERIANAAISLFDPSGSECDRGYTQSVRFFGENPLLSAHALTWKPDSSNACNTADRVELRVRGSQKNIAVVDTQGASLELVVVEELPVPDAAELPVPDDTLRWQRMKAGPPIPGVVAGSSMSDAPLLKPGSYAMSVLTGESQVVAVDLDWGQRLRAEAVVAPRTGELADLVDVVDGLDVQLLGAVRGPYDSLSVSGAPTRTVRLQNDARTYRAGGTTPVIRYLNRRVEGATAASVPGRQYVVISYSTDPENTYLLPYTLILKVVGTAGQGAPKYGIPAPPSPSPTPAPSASPPREASAIPARPVSTAPQGNPAGGDHQNAQPWGLTVVLVLAVALLGGSVATVLIRRRRSRPPGVSRSGAS